MNLLFHVIYAAHARSTHHKLALHALMELKGPHSQRWADLFLKHHHRFLTGAKDPDKKFKDFRNHVLHVEQNNWGGAPGAARKWYDETVASLRKRDFGKAVYAAGVLSHYYSDPIMPFHTGSSEKETNVHRAAEWSICKAYEELREIREQDLGEIRVRVPKQPDWLEQMVIRGAEKSHHYYDELIDRYDIHSGVIDPPSGLDGQSMRFLAELLGYAAVGFARILDRAFEEAAVKPPASQLTVETFLATLEVPIRWVTNKMADTVERRQIEAMYTELCETGRVDATLPADDRAIRDAAAAVGYGEQEKQERAQRRIEEVEERAGLRKRPAEQEPIESEYDDEETEEESVAESKPTFASRFASLRTYFQRDDRKVASKSDDDQAEVDDEEAMSDDEVDADDYTTEVEATDEYGDQDDDYETADNASVSFQSHAAREDESEDDDSQRFHLNRSDDVVDAPSIGPKTAKRLAKAGIKTVYDLLAADPDQVSQQVATRHITAELVIDWQDQALLACTIPNLRGHDAQILVACDYRTANDVAACSIVELVAEAESFCATQAGQRVIRSGKVPDREEVSDWIAWASMARRAEAA